MSKRIVQPIGLCAVIVGVPHAETVSFGEGGLAFEIAGVLGLRTDEVEWSRSVSRPQRLVKETSMSLRSIILLLAFGSIANAQVDTADAFINRDGHIVLVTERYTTSAMELHSPGMHLIPATEFPIFTAAARNTSEEMFIVAIPDVQLKGIKVTGVRYDAPVETDFGEIISDLSLGLHSAGFLKVPVCQGRPCNPIPDSILEPGDFNRDGSVSTEDIDLLTVATRVAVVDDSFDLNDDGSVDEVDRTVWVEELVGTHFGDADLDRSVDFEDFLSLFDSFDQESGWAGGDFDGSGLTDFQDFLILSDNFGKDGATASVPEPDSAMVLVGAAAGVLTVRSRR